MAKDGRKLMARINPTNALPPEALGERASEADVARIPPVLFLVEGPLEERREVETPWGPAWAEVGTWVAERVDADDEPTGEVHIVHPDDFERLYRDPS